MHDREQQVSPAQLRSFGLLVGGVFAVIGVWPVLFHGGGPRAWAVAVAALLVAPALIAPRSLEAVHKGWMRIGTVLGWVNTRIILGLSFYGLFTPMGILMRLAKKDPMRRRFDATLSTYRVSRTPRDGSHMKRQF